MGVKIERDLTTGIVAKACGVSKMLVGKWCDNELLPSYRIPGSTHRRIRKDEAVRFMITHNIPLPKWFME